MAIWLAYAFQGFINNRQEKPSWFSFLLPVLTARCVDLAYFVVELFSFSSHLPHSAFKFPGDQGSVGYAGTSSVSLMSHYPPVELPGKGLLWFHKNST